MLSDASHVAPGFETHCERPSQRRRRRHSRINYRDRDGSPRRNPECVMRLARFISRRKATAISITNYPSVSGSYQYCLFGAEWFVTDRGRRLRLLGPAPAGQKNMLVDAQPASKSHSQAPHPISTPKDRFRDQDAHTKTPK